MTKDTIDYQIGASDVNTDVVDSEGEFIPFQMESRALFSTLAEDIYPSPRAGIRESISNSISATMRAVENHSISKNESVIEVFLDETLENPLLVIEDNGDGMTMNKIKKVVSYIGRSTVRDDYNKVGQFGMGFLAIFSLCGTDGGFIMHTNSRKTEGAISGSWKDGGFSSYSEPTEYAENMEGTRLEIFIKDDISTENLHNWIEEIAEWSRIPILYERKTQNDISSYEFGGKDIESLQKNNSPYVTIETDYYKVICSDSLSDNPTILLDVPIDRVVENIPHAPFNSMAIRFKTEHPIIVSGENEGKMVVSDTEYKNMTEGRKNKYIPQKNVPDKLPVTPAPTGARERLETSHQFWSYIGIELKNKYDKRISEVISDITNNGFRSITPEKWHLIQREIPNYASSYRAFITIMSSRFEDISEETIEKIYAASNNILVSDVDKKYNPSLSKNFERINIGRLQIEDPDYVFMFINHVNKKKSARVINSEEDTRFVKVENSDWYNFYSTVFGWEKLSDVTEDHEICSSIEDEVLENITNDNYDNKNNKPDNKFTLHSKRKRYNLTYEELCDLIKTEGQSHVLEISKNRPIRELLVFSKEDNNYNVSDYTWMKSKDNAFVNVSEKNMSDIMSLPVSRNIDSYITEAKSYTTTTSEGIIELGGINLSNSIIHIVSEELYGFVDGDVNKCVSMRELFKNQNFYGVEAPNNKETYVLLKLSDVDKVLPIIANSIVVNSTDTILPLQTIDGPTVSQCKLYIHSFDARDTDVVKIMDEKICSQEPIESSQSPVIPLFDEVCNSDIDLDEVSNHD